MTIKQCRRTGQFSLRGEPQVSRPNMYLFTPACAQKSSGFPEYLYMFCPEYGNLKSYRADRGLSSQPPPPPSLYGNPSMSMVIGIAYTRTVVSHCSLGFAFIAFFLIDECNDGVLTYSEHVLGASCPLTLSARIILENAPLERVNS